VSENRVLRKIFEPKKEEVAGYWRRLHNEELHNLNALPNIITAIKITEDEMGGSCRMHERDGKCTQYFDWKTRREETTWKT
jgi:hypothetical protein